MKRHVWPAAALVAAVLALQGAQAQRGNAQRGNAQRGNADDTRLGLLAGQLGVSPVPGGRPTGLGVPGGLIPGRDTGCWCQPVNQVCTPLRPLNLDLVTRILNRPGSAGAGGPVCAEGDSRVCCPGPTPLSEPQGSQCGAPQPFGVPPAVSPTADFGEYAFMAVVLGPGQSYVSGGALISRNLVLTAAHKLPGPNGLTVRLGDYDVSQATDVPQFPSLTVNVVNVIINPGFNPRTLANDVALLRLQQNVNLQAFPHIVPASLPLQGETFTGQRCFVAGWGSSAFDQAAFQSKLQEVDVPVLDPNLCQNMLRGTRLGQGFTLDQFSFICAGGEVDKDACSGDGGSPLVCCTGPNTWTVVGLVAWGVGCGEANVPGVYVNVPNYANFINQVANTG